MTNKTAIATSENVYEACDDLVREGADPHKISSREILDRIGGGSLGTITRLRDQWLAERSNAPLLALALENETKLIGVVCQIVAAETAGTRQGLQGTIDSQLADLEFARNEQELLVKALSQAENALASAQDESGRLQRDCDRLKGANEELKRQLDSAHEKLVPRERVVATGGASESSAEQTKPAAPLNQTSTPAAAPQPPQMNLSSAADPGAASIKALVAPIADQRAEVGLARNDGAAESGPGRVVPAPPTSPGGTAAGAPPKPAAVASPTPPTPVPAGAPSGSTSRNTGVAGSPAAPSTATSSPSISTDSGNAAGAAPKPASVAPTPPRPVPAAAPAGPVASGDPSPTPATAKPTTGDSRANGDGGRGESGS